MATAGRADAGEGLPRAVAQSRRGHLRREDLPPAPRRTSPSSPLPFRPFRTLTLIDTKGNHFISSDTLANPPTPLLTHFPSAELPVEPGARLAKLFLTRPCWKVEELAPLWTLRSTRGSGTSCCSSMRARSWTRPGSGTRRGQSMVPEALVCPRAARMMCGLRRSVGARPTRGTGFALCADGGEYGAKRMCMFGTTQYKACGFLFPPSSYSPALFAHITRAAFSAG